MDLAPLNPADTSVTEIGRFALEEENKKLQIKLKFVSVVHGFKGSVVGGKIYALILKIRDANDDPFEHKAVVFKDADEGLKSKGYWL